MNDNRTKFEGKATANVYLDGTNQQLEFLIEIKNKHLLPTRTRLDGKIGKNTRIGQNHHKHQPSEKATEHDRTKHNNAQT